MKIETVPLEELTLDPANVRRHGPRDLEAIKASLTRFEQQEPLIVDKRGVVRGGNGRLQAMRELGWTEAQVVYTDLEGAEATALAIALNRTGELSGWDVEALSGVLAALREDDPDLFSATGFDQEALSQALGGIDPGVGDGIGGEPGTSLELEQADERTRLDHDTEPPVQEAKPKRCEKCRPCDECAGVA